MSKKTPATDTLELVRGSGNVYRDFELANADLRQAKATLADRIIAELDRRKLTVRAAHKETGFAAGDFSRIRNADLGRFSVDRLIKILGALDADTQVIINLAPRAGEKGHTLAL